MKHVCTPEQAMKAHQFLYYVRCQPVLSDYDYDHFCKANGLIGCGGSDSYEDYSPEVIALAESFLRDVSLSK